MYYLVPFCGWFLPVLAIGAVAVVAVAGACHCSKKGEQTKEK